MSFRQLSFTMYSIVGLLGACSNNPPTNFAISQARQASYELNGLMSNGLNANGLRPNGVTFSGVSFSGMTLNGNNVTDVALSGSNITGKINGSTVSGSDLTGAVMAGVMSDSSILYTNIDSVTWSSTYNMYLYNMSFQTSSGPITACGYDSNNNEIPVVALAGTWDYYTADHTDSSTLFTIACTSTALGKCAKWGYRPWDTAYEGTTQQSLAEWHQACTRMVRGDYCGDGVPHTRNGTTINVWDNLGIQTPDTTSWLREAEWTATGARCIDHTRWVSAIDMSDTDIDYVWNNCPDRLTVNDTTGTCIQWSNDESTWCEQNSDCGSGQVCIDDFCATAPSGAAIGASCTQNSDCASNSCVSSVCADPSDFTTANGLSVDLSVRRLLRNQSDYNQ